jgi:hypothetical protein
MRNLFIVFILAILTSSCIKEYDLKLESNEPKLVVEGSITNQNGPYYVRLTKSSADFNIDTSVRPENDTTYLYSNDRALPVKDAEIYITDNNTSFTDTLAPCSAGSWFHYKDSIHNIDYSRFEIPQKTIHTGYYETSKLKGVAGHTYSLTIKWQNKEYHAESYMPPVPLLDSVKLDFTQGAVGKSDYCIPLIYFKEPQNERNYYLFITQNAAYTWPYSVLSDEYLNSYVNGLDVCKGVSPYYWRTAYPFVIGGRMREDYFVEMHSITKEAYEYYHALLQQFKTDGGGYSPSPASAPTNLDNGALGFFRASAVDRVDFKQDNGN